MKSNYTTAKDVSHGISKKRLNFDVLLPANGRKTKMRHEENEENKKTSMPNTVKSLGYIKWYSLSSHRSIKSTSNCIRYNCQKICSWSRRPKTILEIKKRPRVSRRCRPFPNIRKYMDHWWDLATIRKKGSFRHILKSLASMHESSGYRFFRTTTGFKCWAPTTVRPHSETTVNSII